MKLLIASFLILFLLAGCGEEKEHGPGTAMQMKAGLLAGPDSTNDFIEIKPVTYSFYTWDGRASFSKLAEEFGDSLARMILSINRLDVRNLRTRDTLVVPDTLSKDFLIYSPFPFSLNKASEIPKILFISQSIQAFGAYEYGILVKWGPTSTGKRSTPTPNGLYHTNWKAKETISTIDEEWLLKWSFNIENFEGISIHEYGMPGYPASHSCARLLQTDAEWLYYWAEQWILTRDEERIIAYGTPVIIFGEYEYGGRKPWLRLAENPEIVSIKEKKIEEILTQYYPVIMERQGVRDSVIAVRDSIKQATNRGNM